MIRWREVCFRRFPMRYEYRQFCLCFGPVVAQMALAGTDQNVAAFVTQRENATANKMRSVIAGTSVQLPT